MAMRDLSKAASHDYHNARALLSRRTVSTADKKQEITSKRFSQAKQTIRRFLSMLWICRDVTPHGVYPPRIWVSPAVSWVIVETHTPRLSGLTVKEILQPPR
jgi:hypothetical protein